jgi:peptidoglycan L-alanyl-D-glutamate endopeptidase CwlK
MIKFLFLSLCFLSFVTISAAQAVADKRGTMRRPIIDSEMSKKEVFDGLDPKCPDDIRKRQRIVKLKYYSFDQKIHQGQLVLDKDLVKDIKVVFREALAERFPIQSVIPTSDMRFRKNGHWDDDLSMIANNTSAFNYRLKTGGTTLSNHATGRAVDINTVQNPYLKGKIVLPPDAKYNPSVTGTFTPDHPLVKLFLKLGWTWGGSWTSPIDYQHFEKPLPAATTAK